MWKRLTLITLALLLSAPLQAAVIKLATVAPEGSEWMTKMRAGAAEVKERTEGRVIVKFYTGGVMGNERKVLRKMRVGQLHGGAFTASGLSEIYPDIALYGLPLLFESLDEVNYVRERLDQRLADGLHEAGLVSFGFAGGGFALMMSNTAVSDLDDLKGRKVWVPEGDKLSYAAMQELGLAPVVLPLTDVLTGLQTGLIDIVAANPVGALVLQWHTKVKYFTDYPVAYVMGVLVVERKIFEKLSEPDQAVVREVMTRIYSAFDEADDRDNTNATEALIASGVQRVVPDSGQIPEWRSRVAASNRREGESGAFDVGFLDEITALIDQFHNDEARRAATP